MAGILSGPPEELLSQESVQVLLRRFHFPDFHHNSIHADGRNFMEEILGDALFSFVVDYS